MATHRQLPNNTDIAPFQEKGRWYRAFIEKDESGNAKLTYKDEGLPEIAPTGYGFTMDGQKDGKNFHLISVSCNPDVGTGTAGDPAFYYPTIGQNYTDGGSQFVVDFNHHESNVGIKLNGNALTPETVVNGINQKNTDFNIKALENIDFIAQLKEGSENSIQSGSEIENGVATLGFILTLAKQAGSNVYIRKTTTDTILTDLNTMFDNYEIPLALLTSTEGDLNVLNFINVRRGFYISENRMSSIEQTESLLTVSDLILQNTITTDNEVSFITYNKTAKYTGDNFNTIQSIQCTSQTFKPSLIYVIGINLKDV